MEVPIDEVSESALRYGRMGVAETSIVRETLSRLASRDQETPYLYFFCDMPLSEINEMEVVDKAEVHGIEGVEITVKTRNPMVRLCYRLYPGLNQTDFCRHKIQKSFYWDFGIFIAKRL